MSEKLSTHSTPREVSDMAAYLYGNYKESYENTENINSDDELIKLTGHLSNETIAKELDYTSKVHIHDGFRGSLYSMDKVRSARKVGLYALDAYPSPETTDDDLIHGSHDLLVNAIDVPATATHYALNKDTYYDIAAIDAHMDGVKLNIDHPLHTPPADKIS